MIGELIFYDIFKLNFSKLANTIMAKFLAALISILGWFSLTLQFVLMMTNAESQDVALTERIVRFFSFFTIQSNILVAFTTTATAFFPDTKLGSFFTWPSTQTAVASYIAIVGIIYSLLLRSVWEPQGLYAVADHLLHDIIPVVFIVYWLIFTLKKDLTWIHPVKWLIFPFSYIVYSLIRGAFVDWYPYHFADVKQLGYPSALRNAAFVLMAFLVVGIVFTAVGKTLSKNAINKIS